MRKGIEERVEEGLRRGVVKWAYFIWSWFRFRFLVWICVLGFGL